MRKTALAIFFLLITLSIRAQQNANTDSLLKLLQHAKEDTTKVLLLIKTGQAFEDRETEKAKQYYRIAGDLSRRINYPQGIIKYIFNYTYILNNMDGDYEASIKLNLQAVDLARKTKDSTNLAKALFNTGNAYRQQGDYEHAVKYYEEGKKIFALRGDAFTKALGDDMLQLLYWQMHQYKKGIKYGVRSVDGLRKAGSQSELGIALSNLGLNYSSAGQFEKAGKVYREALKIGKETGDKYVELTQYLNLADVNMNLYQLDALKTSFEKALVLARELKSNQSIIACLRGLSYYHFYKKEFGQSKLFADSALRLSYKYGQRLERQKTFDHLSNLAYAMNDITLGRKYTRQSVALNDSLLNEKISLNADALEKKYEFEKKEGRIKQLKTERKVQNLVIKQKSMLNELLIAGVAVALIIALLSFYTYNQKQRLQQSRISELEAEKQLGNAEAVLKGEEQERARMAKDLHDGLGGMLSGVKFSLNNVRGNLVLTADDARAFERSLDMLDSSIGEMRRVAHNMLPEALIRYGLNTALEGFCHDITNSWAVKVHYQSIGLDGIELDQSRAITIYRIVQELLNNILKHAAATKAIVQLTKADDLLSITVEDDGTGFDTATLANAKGIGISNIQNRVNFLNGKLDIDSQPGKGTSILIEIPI